MNMQFPDSEMAQVQPHIYTAPAADIKESYISVFGKIVVAGFAAVTLITVVNYGPLIESLRHNNIRKRLGPNAVYLGDEKCNLDYVLGMRVPDSLKVYSINEDVNGDGIIESVMHTINLNSGVDTSKLLEFDGEQFSLRPFEVNEGHIVYMDKAKH